MPDCDEDCEGKEEGVDYYCGEGDVESLGAHFLGIGIF